MILGATNSTTPSDLIGLTRFLTNTTDDTSVFSDTNIVALLNQSYDDVQTFIIDSAMTHWKGESEVKTADIVAGQKEYNFPSDILTIDRMEISYDGSYWYPADYKSIDQFQGAFSNLASGEGVIGKENAPSYYIYDYSVWLDPKPDTAVDDGIKLWYSVNVADLSNSGTGTGAEPVFNKAFHDLLSYYTASKWCGIKELWNKKGSLDKDINKMKEELKSFYTKRTLDKKPRLTRRQQKFE